MNPLIQLKETTPLILIVILLAWFAPPHRARADGPAAVLAGHRWEVRSDGLACEGLIAVFHAGGTFEGMLENPPDDAIIRPQRVRGQWRVTGPVLVLSYNYTDSLSGPAGAQFMIQITGVSERILEGIQKVHLVYPYGGDQETLRSWEFIRRD